MDVMISDVIIYILIFAKIRILSGTESRQAERCS